MERCPRPRAGPGVTVAGAPLQSRLAADIEDNASLIYCAAEGLGELGLLATDTFPYTATFLKRCQCSAIPPAYSGPGDSLDDAKALLKLVEGFAALHAKAWTLCSSATPSGPSEAASSLSTVTSAEGGLQMPHAVPAGHGALESSPAQSNFLMALTSSTDQKQVHVAPADALGASAASTTGVHPSGDNDHLAALAGWPCWSGHRGQSRLAREVRKGVSKL